MRSLLAGLAVLSTSVWAAGHGELDQTLRQLADAYRQSAEVARVEVDPVDVSILVVLTDGRELTSYPDNLHDTLAKEPDASARAEMVDTFVERIMIDLALQTPDTDEALDLSRLMPVIRQSGYGAGLADEAPMSRPFLAELSVFLVEDSANSVRYLTPSIVAPSGLEFAELEARAIDNIARLTDPPTIEGDWIYLLTVDGFYESSYLLVPDLWQRIDEQIGTIVAVAPARDVVVFIDGDDEAALKELRDVLSENEGQLAYELSGSLLKWTGSGWALLD